MASPVSADMSAQYQQKFETLLAKLGQGAEWQAFLNNPKPYLDQAGIPLVDQTEDPDPMLPTASSSGLTIQKKWWGQNWIMDETLTQNIVDGIEGSGALAEALGATLGVGEILALPIVLGLLTKVGAIKLADKGKGVCWPISWFQWAVLAASFPGGPAGIAVAAEGVLWPKGND